MLFICNGMTRSGSTLQYNLVRELVTFHNAGAIHGFVEDPDSLGKLESSWFDDAAIHVIKMHAFWRPASGEQVSRSYVYRDLRDVAASVKRKFPVTFEETLGILDEAVATDELIRQEKRVSVQRYEHLYKNPEETCRQLANFLALPTTDSACSEITASCLQQIDDAISNFPSQKKHAHRTSYKRARFIKTRVDFIPTRWKQAWKDTLLHSLYQRITKLRSQADPLTLIHPDHFSPSRGKPGMWRECFTIDEQRTLQSRYTAWLEQNGYELQPI